MKDHESLHPESPSTKSSDSCPDNEVEIIEEEIVEGARVRHKGIYLLPNLFTTASLFSGFYAIVAAANGKLADAAVAVFVSMVLDGLDGRVARLTNTQSKFGAEYDSLSDMVAFGVAPAMVAFFWCLNSLGKFGWMVTFIYVAGAALRLARFNTQIGSADKRYFVGLPSPSAAAVIAGMVWCFHDFMPTGILAVLAALMVGGVGILMVSNIPYYSFKELDFKGRVPFWAVLIIVFVFALAMLSPEEFLFFGFLAYMAAGPLIALRRKLFLR